LTKIPFQQTHSFSDFFLDYIQQKDELKPFYDRFPELSTFIEQIGDKQRSFPERHREVLAAELTNQYKDLTITEHVKQNLRLLKQSNTFTITTGHQLNIFTGPLYFIYKIITVINACKKLKEQYPAFDFVPVYWMASE